MHTTKKQTQITRNNNIFKQNNTQSNQRRDMADFLVILSFAVALVNVAFIFMLYKLVISKFTEYDQRINEFSVDSELQAVFTEKTEDHEEFDKVVLELYNKVKHTFKIEAKSYAELVEKLKFKRDINEKLRVNLVEFFEKMIIFSYKSNDISDEEKAIIRKELKSIIRMFQNDEFK